MNYNKKIKQEIGNFFKIFSPWIYVFFPIAAYFFAVPYPFPQPASALVIKNLKAFLIPNVDIIVTGPMEAFTAQTIISLLMEFIVSLPLLILRIASFVNPSLYPKERKLLVSSIIPSTTLFVFGFVLATMFVIPFTVKFLYQFAAGIGARSFISVGNFISLVAVMGLASGIFFQLPVLIYVLTRIKIVKPEFWIKQWRWAVVIFFVLAASITPDGTGITALFLTVTLTLFYFLTSFICRKYTIPDV